MLAAPTTARQRHAARTSHSQIGNAEPHEPEAVEPEERDESDEPSDEESKELPPEAKESEDWSEPEEDDESKAVIVVVAGGASVGASVFSATTTGAGSLSRAFTSGSASPSFLLPTVAPTAPPIAATPAAVPTAMPAISASDNPFTGVQSGSGVVPGATVSHAPPDTAVRANPASNTAMMRVDAMATTKVRQVPKAGSKHC